MQACYLFLNDVKVEIIHQKLAKTDPERHHEQRLLQTEGEQKYLYWPVLFYKWEFVYVCLRYKYCTLKPPCNSGFLVICSFLLFCDIKSHCDFHDHVTNSKSPLQHTTNPPSSVSPRPTPTSAVLPPILTPDHGQSIQYIFTPSLTSYSPGD